MPDAVPNDPELLNELQRLSELAPMSSSQQPNKEAQLLIAMQLDTLCLSFERQKNELMKKKSDKEAAISRQSTVITKEDWIHYINRIQEELRTQAVGEVAQERYKRDIETGRKLISEYEVIDNQVQAIDQRIARYRAVADKILDGFDSPKE